MRKNIKQILIIGTYICAFTIVFDDWVTGLAVGTALGVAVTDDNNDKSCCK